MLWNIRETNSLTWNFAKRLVGIACKETKNIGMGISYHLDCYFKHRYWHRPSQSVHPCTYKHTESSWSTPQGSRLRTGHLICRSFVYAVVHRHGASILSKNRRRVIAFQHHHFLRSKNQTYTKPLANETVNLNAGRCLCKALFRLRRGCERRLISCIAAHREA